MLSATEVQTRGCEEMSVWKYWLSTLSPERLSQQRQYDRDRAKKYNEKHKEELKRITREKLTCNVCGAECQACEMQRHLRRIKHRKALDKLDQQQQKDLEQQRLEYMKRRKEERHQNYQEEVRCSICNVVYKVRHLSRHIKTMDHVKALEERQEINGEG